MQLDADTAWQRAVRWLTGRDHSAHEIAQRLATAGFSADVVDATLQRLVAAGYVDDLRYARQRCEALSRRGCGSERAAAELTAKGVGAAIAEGVIAEVFAQEERLAASALSRRFPSPPHSEAERARAARFLAGRGFPEAVVLAILEQGC